MLWAKAKPSLLRTFAPGWGCPYQVDEKALLTNELAQGVLFPAGSHAFSGSPRPWLIQGPYSQLQPILCPYSGGHLPALPSTQTQFNYSL